MAAASIGFMSACASRAVPASTATLGSETRSYAPHMLMVHGTIAEVDGQTVARIDPFQSPHRPLPGAPVEIYLPAFPTEEFDAVVTNVTPYDPFTLRADAEIVHGDPRLVPGTMFVAQIAVIRPEARPTPGTAEPSAGMTIDDRLRSGSSRNPLLPQ